MTDRSAPYPVREVQPGDRPEWVRMRHALWPHHSVEEHQADVAVMPGEHNPDLAAVFVAPRAEGRLCGFLEMSVRSYAEGCDGPTPYVEAWYTDEDVRGTGVGAALVAAAEAWAAARGFREMASDALLDNVGSHRAHRALGFQEVERSVHFRKDIG
ncbi:MAG TPA: GNAT family N-acetyltransferase [Longimicrobium sp.]|nr:GNAT family N-acetyltransferase [Longimicrobium sp.]